MGLRLRSERAEAGLTSRDPAARLDAVTALRPRAVDKLRGRAHGWPPLSPGSIGSWLLLVTTKPPQWRDPLLAFPEQPLAAGHPHEGWFYPDPIGFWAECRRWATLVVRARRPVWASSEALAVSALVHLADEPDRLLVARDVCRPRVVLFLDEPALQAARLDVAEVAQHQLPDPHRDGQVYQGFWGREAGDGSIVGKAPQHPSAHRLYRTADMDRFLRALPLDQ